MYGLENIDRAILDALQGDFPLAGRPFAVLGQKLGLSEQEMLARVAKLSAAGYLRHIGAFFSSRRLGYRGTLIALAVEPTELESVANAVNEYGGVTHNYQRDCEYQLWFTLLARETAVKEKIVAAVAALPGVKKTLDLPTVKTYKVRVTLPMGGEPPAAGRAQNAAAPSNPLTADIAAPLSAQENFSVDALDKVVIRAMNDDMPLVAEPYKILAEPTGLTAADFIARLVKLKERGIIRRMGAVLQHRRAGFAANALCAWVVPTAAIDELGRNLAAEPTISHCYRRAVATDWPYNLYTVFHARTVADCEAMAVAVADRYGLTDRRMLYSVREWKKSTLAYFAGEE